MFEYLPCVLCNAGSDSLPSQLAASDDTSEDTAMEDVTFSREHDYGLSVAPAEQWPVREANINEGYLRLQGGVSATGGDTPEIVWEVDENPSGQ